MFSSLSQKFPELTFIDPNKAMCEKGICHAMIDGVPLYRDPEHLNDAGSRVIGNALLKQDIHLVAPNIVLSGLYR
jgi:hypothetical protein